MTKKNFAIVGLAILLVVVLFFSINKTGDNSEEEDVANLSTVKNSTSESTVSTTTVAETKTEKESESESESSSAPVTTTGEMINAEVTTTIPVVENVGDIDEEVVSKLTKFVDPIYFNIIFGNKSFDEGFTEKDMKLFAISYIYQHEHKDLKFDTEKFILYVPSKRVEELVKSYFDVTVQGHATYEEEGIEFKNGFYLMPAADTIWTEHMIVEKVEKINADTYEVKVMFDSPDGALPKKLITVQEKDGKYILKGYKNIL